MIIDPATVPSTEIHLTALLLPIMTAIIGGGIAFGASWATNRFSNARLREQFALEKEASTATNRRVKGEELFVVLHFWYSQLAGHYISMTMAMQGKLSVSQVLDADIERGREFGSKYEAPRIELYIKAYFPSCTVLHSELQLRVNKLNGLDADFKGPYNVGTFNGTRLINDYVAAQMEFERCYQALKEKLIMDLRSI